MRFLGSSTPKMRLRPGFRPGSRWGSLHRYSRTIVGGEEARCPLPKNATPLSALGLELRPFGPSVPIVPILRNDHWAGFNVANTSKVAVNSCGIMSSRWPRCSTGNVLWVKHETQQIQRSHLSCYSAVHVYIREIFVQSHAVNWYQSKAYIRFLNSEK